MIAKPSGKEISSFDFRFQTLPVAVVLGNPQTDNCKGHGICHLDPVGTDHRPCGCLYTGAAFLSVPTNNTLKLSFWERSLHPHTLEIYFSTGFFLVEAPYSVPEAVSGRLEADLVAKCIQPGLYPVKVCDGRLEVVLSLG